MMAERGLKVHYLWCAVDPKNQVGHADLLKRSLDSWRNIAQNPLSV